MRVARLLLPVKNKLQWDCHLYLRQTVCDVRETLLVPYADHKGYKAVQRLAEMTAVSLGAN